MLPQLNFTVLDTETTGLVPKVNRVIEFASVRYKDGNKVDEYEVLISVPGDIPPPVVALTHIQPEDLDGKPSFDELRDEIIEHIGDDTIIVGQNVGFDIRMLKGEGIDLSERLWFDTSMLASLVFPEFQSYSLGYMSQVLDLNHEPVHRALGDVHATTELLEKIWERLGDLPEELRSQLDSHMKKAPESYRKLFGALPDVSAKQAPKWLQPPSQLRKAKPLPERAKFDLPQGDYATVSLVEAPLDNEFVPHVIAAAKHQRIPTWIAVKNLSHALNRMDIPDDIRVIYPPLHLSDPEAIEQLLKQESFTTDEASLATKLDWYMPHMQQDIPVHGEEKSIWNGKLACTQETTKYTDQFSDLPDVVLIDHWQLLRILQDPAHPGYEAIQQAKRVIVDDASMLEDTATKAFGNYCKLDDFRAAASGDGMLSKCADLLQLWVEKTRKEQEVHYMSAQDLYASDAQNLREQLAILGARDDLSLQLSSMISNLQLLLDPEKLDGTITFIEVRQDQSQHLQSAPARVGPLLQSRLYDLLPTVLLIPPGSQNTLNQILPPNTRTTLVEGCMASQEAPLLEIDTERNVRDILSDPPDGKTVLLLGSRRGIEQTFVNYSEALEEQGITLICQGYSGGMGRMQAEFTAAEGKVIWAITPWSFEGIQIPEDQIDQLVLEKFPFDHPSHTIMSKRSDYYQNAFMEYSLPRTEHRVYRVLRTFCQFRKGRGEILILDERIDTKRYGPRLKAYAESLVASEASESSGIPEEDYENQGGKNPGTDHADQMTMFEV